MWSIKRLLFLFILSIGLVLSLSFFDANAASSYGNDYQKYTSLTLSRGRMLSSYSSDELNSIIKQKCKRKFYGWRISYINQRVKCKFISETVLSTYNDGTSAIKYKVSEVKTKVYKTSISATGSIGTTVKGEIKKFKGDLSQSLKLTGEYSQTVEIKNTESLEIEVDPNTRLTMYLAGEGYLYTGVARFYQFWIGRYKGGFEYFQVADIYPKIVKTSL